MNLALAANTSGMGFIGDPPLIFSFFRHPKLFDGPAGMTQALSDHFIFLSGEGLLYSALANTAMNREWLKRTGLFAADAETHKHIGRQFGKYFIEGFKTLSFSPFSTEIRDVMWFGTQEYSRQLTELLAQFEDNDQEHLQKIKGLLKSIPHPLVEFNVVDFIKDLVSSLNQIAAFIQTMPQTLLARWQDPDFQQRLMQAEDTITANPFAEEVLKNTQQLSDFLLDVLTKKNGSDQLIAQMHQLSAAVKFPPSFDHLKQFSTFISLADDDEKRKSLEDWNGSLGPSEVQTAVNLMLDTYRDIKFRESEGQNAFLGPIARDVLFALFTQLPAVPSLSRLAGVTLESALGLQTNQKTPEWKIDLATLSVLGVTAGLSGFADNAAAYLFGAQDLEEFYRKVYGQQYDQNPQLQSQANLSALIASISGGSLSKYGNGPNFQFQKICAHIRSNHSGTGSIEITTEPLTLRGSLKNPYAQLQNAVLVTALTARRRLIAPQAV